jgi:hypothetical protein
VNIYPQDLGPELSADVCEQRQMFPADFQGKHIALPPVRKSNGHFTEFYVWIMVLGLASQHFGIALSFIGSFVVIRFLIRAFKRGDIALQTSSRRVLHEPLAALLMVHEIRHLQQMDRDSLSRSYLELVISAIDTPCDRDSETEQSVREALLALATSMANLPAPSARDTQETPAALQAEAGKLSADADRETDAVVTSSLRRRAEALLRQAEIAGQTSLLLRRNEALRLEVAGQIAALQTSLTALRVGGSQAVYELAGVAASIQQVALEAGALTQARSEIGDIVNTFQQEPPQYIRQVRPR